MNYPQALKQLKMPRSTLPVAALIQWRHLHKIARQKGYEARERVLSQVKEAIKRRLNPHCDWPGCGVTLDVENITGRCYMHRGDHLSVQYLRSLTEKDG